MRRLLALLRNVFQAGRGRPAAVGLLAAVLLGVALFPDLPPLRSGRLALFDSYQTWMPRQRVSQDAVVVEIDEATLGALGQWPWPRTYIAALIDAIAASGPAAVGLDMYFPEADHSSPEALAEFRTDLNAATRQALGRLPSNDHILAASLNQAPTVLGVAGFAFPTHATRAGLLGAPMEVDADIPSRLNHYPYVLSSLPQLQAAARGWALLSAEPEKGVVRRVPLLAAISDGRQVVPALTLEMLHVGRKAKALAAHDTPQGIAVAIDDLPVALEANGEAWVHFSSADDSRQRSISALAILKGEVPAERLTGKYVLLGLTGMGLQDQIVTPLGDRRPGVDVHAELIESVLDGHFLRRPPALRWTELGLLLVGGLFLIWAVPNVKPRIATFLATILFVVLFGSGVILFKTAGLLLDAASVFAGLNVVFGSLLGSVFIETDRQRRQAEAALQREKEAAARVAGELAAARRIQLGSLPKASELFARETRFQVAAHLEPAREVGGDLYDFFMLDARRLFFVVGDVSGKGLPASLFMAVAKALEKSVALRDGGSTVGIETIVATANKELSRENPEMLFVTLLAGILDAETGAVEMVNAGHDAPWRLRTDGSLEQMSGEGGPPLCVLDDFPYPAQRFTLAAGETLCVVTDGITEAMNSKGELYGTARLEAAFKNMAVNTSADALLHALREDVSRYVDGAEASDDLTLLVIQRRATV